MSGLDFRPEKRNHLSSIDDRLPSICNHVSSICGLIPEDGTPATGLSPEEEVMLEEVAALEETLREVSSSRLAPLSS